MLHCNYSEEVFNLSFKGYVKLVLPGYKKGKNKSVATGWSDTFHILPLLQIFADKLLTARVLRANKENNGISLVSERFMFCSGITTSGFPFMNQNKLQTIIQKTVQPKSILQTEKKHGSLTSKKNLQPLCML